MINTDASNPLAPTELLEILNKLDEDNYIILCHSEKVEEVKTWNLPYKVMGNNWFDKSIVNKEMVYVIPDYKNKPITVINE